jgi:hypothetical protein
MDPRIRIRIHTTMSFNRNTAYCLPVQISRGMQGPCAVGVPPDESHQGSHQHQSPHQPHHIRVKRGGALDMIVTWQQQQQALEEPWTRLGIILHMLVR